MKYIKLFKESNISKSEFPLYHHANPIPKRLLDDMLSVVDKEFLIRIDGTNPDLDIIEDDGYYYVRDHEYNNYSFFSSIQDLKDYVYIKYYYKPIYNIPNEEKILKILRKTKLDLSIDDCFIIKKACENKHLKVINFLLNSKPDKTLFDKYQFWMCYYKII